MQLTLKEKREEAPGVVSFLWEPQAPLSWKPGQYLHYVLPHQSADDRGQERWFTNSAAPFEGRAMITTRHAAGKSSSFKEALFGLEPGAIIEADGPEGEFTVEDLAQEHVFIAGGIGITPFRSIIAQAAHDKAPLKATLIYGNRDAQAPFKKELGDAAAQNQNLKIDYVLGPAVIDEAAIRRAVPELAAPLFYISGPEPMVKSLAEKLAGMGVPQAHIKLDDFPGYEAHY